MNDNGSAFNAADYDSEIGRTLPYQDEFYKQAVDAVRHCRTGAVSWLDVGCGTGKMAQAALGQVPLDRFVFCDSSAAMLERAKARLAFPGASFFRADVRELPFKNEFDVVTAIQVNHYLQKEERVAALMACHGALREGGVLISFENFAPDGEQMERIYLERWRSYQLAQGKSHEECESHMARYGKAYFPIPLSEHFAALRCCGFRAVEILWLSYMQVGFLAIK
ncbi:class I SAM-dependent methyltransferase [Butyricicoccus faecihominis]|uniref:class I SAM-dependent methyltransferase n=1 Tax=Butyricicoccus faecihominis TaxID=1712515 RepID=UPI00247A6179|nr:class I SAM-dependent methyltransferase [Butyricicoccus faecihominis]MCQ5130030.1 class I SAM-dependent methyltransferase [Butyricicoccus faecihominis]